jgi:5-methylcytosine-specific restriction enzyme A
MPRIRSGEVKAVVPCKHAGCSYIVKSGFCSQHAKDKNKRKANTNAYHKWYSSSAWVRARKSFLACNPLCVSCEKLGATTIATVVDHVVPHKGCAIMFWDSSNWQSMCKRCHDAKTIGEGAFNP